MVAMSFVRSADEILPREVARRRLRLGEDELVFYIGLGGGGTPQNDEAVGHYRKAVEINPQFAAAHKNLGLTLKAAGKLVEARKHLRRARQLERR